MAKTFKQKNPYGKLFSREKPTDNWCSGIFGGEDESERLVFLFNGDKTNPSGWAFGGHTQWMTLCVPVASIYIEGKDKEGRIRCTNIRVKSDFKRRGLGTALVKNACRVYRAKKIAFINR